MRNEIETNPVKVFLTAVENCTPVVMLKPIVKGGITYKVPVPISEKEKRFRAMKFIINTCSENPKERNKRLKYSVKLSEELLAASENRVSVYKEDARKPGLNNIINIFL